MGYFINSFNEGLINFQPAVFVVIYLFLSNKWPKFKWLEAMKILNISYLIVYWVEYAQVNDSQLQSPKMVQSKEMASKSSARCCWLLAGN